jgi:hypothetical protein
MGKRTICVRRRTAGSFGQTPGNRYGGTPPQTCIRVQFNPLRMILIPKHRPCAAPRSVRHSRSALREAQVRTDRVRRCGPSARSNRGARSRHSARPGAGTPRAQLRHGNAADERFSGKTFPFSFSRNVPMGAGVLASFDPRWPVLKSTSGPFYRNWARVSNIIQTRPHNRLRLSNTERFPVISPRLKSARGRSPMLSVRCLSGVRYA